MSQINCLASSHGSLANLHGDMSERNTEQCAIPSAVTIILTCFYRLGTQHFNSSQIHKNNGRNLLETHTHTHWACSRLPEKHSYLFCA